jgi:hypothetical protein
LNIETYLLVAVVAAGAFTIYKITILYYQTKGGDDAKGKDPEDIERKEIRSSQPGNQCQVRCDKKA